MAPSETPNQAILKDKTGNAVALESVHANGVLNGLLLRMTLRQVYRNTGANNIETIYTFPLSWGATLMSMKVTLNGKELDGQIVEKKAAEAAYEKAIAEGDLPVMLERSGKDLYTANLGNLQPGDKATIEIEFAQLLDIDQGHLRITVPTTFAPRYGNPLAAGMAAHQSTDADPLAAYGFTLNLDVLNPIAAKGHCRSPSHHVTPVPHEGGVMFSIKNRQAMLDRDFVLTIDGLDGMALVVADEDPCEPGIFTVLGSFEARLPQELLERPQPLRLKLLVDCSGSMAGDSMALAQDALYWIIAQLGEADRASYSAFGSWCHHRINKLTRCTTATVELLKTHVRQTRADLGGTEMNAALEKVIDILDLGRLRPKPADILMITDGEIWDIDETVATVRNGGHRLFAIGVGSAPAESLLKELAEVSGGACELIGTNENMGEAVMRLIDRMRQSHPMEVGIQDLRLNPVVVSTMRPVCDGQTLHVWTRMAVKPDRAPTLLCGTELSQASLNWDADGTLSRLHANHQLQTMTLPSQATAFALKYQLISRFTNYLLVHKRGEGERASGLPHLQQIRSMLAAGHAGSGSVRDRSASRALPSLAPHGMDIGEASTSDLSRPAVWRQSRSPAKAAPAPSTSFGQLADKLISPDHPIARLIVNFNANALKHAQFQAALEASIQGLDFGYLTDLFKSLDGEIADRPTAWALLLLWFIEVKGLNPGLERHGQRLLDQQLLGLPPDSKAAAYARFEADFRQASDMDDVEIPAFLRRQARQTGCGSL